MPLSRLGGPASDWTAIPSLDRENPCKSLVRPTGPASPTILDICVEDPQCIGGRSGLARSQVFFVIPEEGCREAIGQLGQLGPGQHFQASMSLLRAADVQARGGRRIGVESPRIVRVAASRVTSAIGGRSRTTNAAVLSKLQ